MWKKVRLPSGRRNAKTTEATSPRGTEAEPTGDLEERRNRRASVSLHRGSTANDGALVNAIEGDRPDPSSGGMRLGLNREVQLSSAGGALSDGGSSSGDALEGWCCSFNVSVE
jgi:hypothetical protein